MRPEQILPWLLGAALGAAGLIQGYHWRSLAPSDDSGETGAKLIALENEVALLKRENESLRSLAQGGGEVHVDTEKALGMDFKSNPLVHRVAGEELRDRIVASIEARYGPHGLDSRQQSWTLMGLLNADDRFAPQLAATKSVGARSWFDEQGGEAWVTDRFDPQSVPDQAALIRALGLPSIFATTQAANGVRGAVRFTRGDHGSLLSPAASLPATLEMQGQMASFLASGGAAVLIQDTSVIRTQ
jgi:hypothetical protein